MGKKLIIKGADFSQNGIAPVATLISGAKTTVDNQVVILPLPQITSEYTYEVVFKNASAFTASNQSVMTLYKGVTYLSCGSGSDGRLLGYNSQTRAAFDSSPCTSKTTIRVSKTQSTRNGTTLDNTVGTAGDAYQASTMYLFGANETSYSAPTGECYIQSVKLYHPTTNELICDWRAAKDQNNKVCFWDLLTDTLAYPSVGDLAEATVE